MKILKWTVLPIIALLSLTSVAFGAGFKMDPGQWRVQTTTTMKGLPMAIPPKTMSMDECVTSEQIDHPWKNMQKNTYCRYTDLKVNDQSATWKITCNGEQAMQGEGAIFLDSPTSYHGYSDMTVQDDKMPMQTHVEYRGHRIGNCSNGS